MIRIPLPVIVGVAAASLVLVSGCSVADLSDSVSSDKASEKAGALNLPAVTGSWTYAAAASIGTGQAGYSGDGGPATAAQVWSPRAIVRAGNGNSYLADTWNNVVRMINSSGNISTIAGNGEPCNGVAPMMTCGDGGPAVRAQLNRPSGLALSADQSTLFIADTNANRVRELNLSAGTITTLAGTGQMGSGGDGAEATQAMLAGPLDVALDPSGNVYIADTDNNRVRVVNTAGVINTVAGTGSQCNPSDGCGDGGPATKAQLSSPSGVAWAGASPFSGQLLISDTNTHSIRMLTGAIPNGQATITTLVGTGEAGRSAEDSPASAAMLNAPRRVTVNGDGSLVISDTGNSRLLYVTPGKDETWTVAANGIAINEPWGVQFSNGGFVYADASANVTSSLTNPTGPSIKWSNCGPDTYTHVGVTNEVTDVVHILPGAVSLFAQAWGAAGGSQDTNLWGTYNGGNGGYAQTTAPVPASKTLAIMVGCAGQVGEPTVNSIWSGGAGGGGATVVADYNGLVNGNTARTVAYVVAGGGGGGAGPLCLQMGLPPQQVCNPVVQSQAGYPGGNGGGVAGGGTYGGAGNGMPGFPDNSADGSLGWGGPGGPGGPGANSAGGWGPSWTQCASYWRGGCVGTGGTGSFESMWKMVGAGGGGGAGGGAGGGFASYNGGYGGGSWSQCPDRTATQTPSSSGGSVVVTFTNQPKQC